MHSIYCVPSAGLCRGCAIAGRRRSAAQRDPNRRHPHERVRRRTTPAACGQPHQRLGQPQHRWTICGSLWQAHRKKQRCSGIKANGCDPKAPRPPPTSSKCRWPGGQPESGPEQLSRQRMAVPDAAA
ncbi:hypothetical protein GHT06_007195 [Daphnia sinensis]|uniref:Uncharacterized protein n=1 Tax=Daphnia sinensis TaxID=1820382 RepID=A0AAD5KD82_9CRUS|nr:hypothetical protein GHT06_006650 [Daphnia sinensis]KAI9549321.1 hypothetical protein GHT06_006620 [Daphnia sinensis]KAI9549395.1 hypothetical protein GHT06_007195 [Daphnia sinensis]